jgi:hypothetical protein
MGTSGAYSGSPGWGDVRDQTQAWLDTGAGGGVDGGSPAPSSIMSALGHALARGGGRGGGGGSGGAGHTGGGGRTSARASTIGGRALAGAYGARSGTAATLGELGLDLAELAGLSRYQQAQRILDAAIGPRGDVLDSELRKTNASVVWWALTEEIEPAPIDLANRWVVEYVWEVWITESGPILQEHSPDSNDRVRVEQEMRAALEATVSAHALPEGRPLATADFTAAIDGALASLRRISGRAA